MESNNVLILFSGGIDSTACLNYYHKLNFQIQLLFIDYGQSAKKKELKAVRAISKYYDVSFNVLQIREGENYEAGLILGRNAVFYFLALMNLKNTHGLIASGIHYGTGYYDCSQDFLDAVQVLIDKYTDRSVIAEAPFINFTKTDIVNYCMREKVPLKLTYSCENGLNQPCGKCPTCNDLILIYERKN
jgi:7-cyano-7-deazaguanine synthase